MNTRNLPGPKAVSKVPKDPNWEKGGLMRVLLDRDSPLYHAVYNQRTACERINSQAQALGIERPKVRNGRSVAHLNTLIYRVSNARALAKAKSINKRLLQNKTVPTLSCARRFLGLTPKATYASKLGTLSRGSQSTKQPTALK